MSHLTIASFKLLFCLVLKAVCCGRWAGGCTVQQLPVGGPQLVSHSANTHLNMSRWSPHEAGANYFSSGVQPGPCPGSIPFSRLLFFFTSHHHHFYFGGVAEASVYFNMTRKTDAGHSCTDVQSDKDLMGRQVWLFNLQRVFREVKWLRWYQLMAGIWEEVQMLFYIWKQLFIPLPYCTVVKSNCPASTHLLKQTFAHHSGMCFSFLYLKSIFVLCCNTQHSLQSQQYLIMNKEGRMEFQFVIQNWIPKRLLQKCERNTDSHFPPFRNIWNCDYAKNWGEKNITFLFTTLHILFKP